MIICPGLAFRVYERIVILAMGKNKGTLRLHVLVRPIHGRTNTMALTIFKGPSDINRRTGQNKFVLNFRILIRAVTGF